VALPRQAERAELLTVLGRALVENGDWQRADGVLGEAVASGEQPFAGHAAVELSLLRLHTDAGATHARVIGELQAPLEIFEALDDRVGLARALTLTGLLTFYSGEGAAAMEELGRAAHYAQEAGDRTQEEKCLAYAVNISIHGPMPVDEALAMVAEMRGRMRGNRRFEANVLGSKAALEAMKGNFDEARKNTEEAGALARELGTAEALAVRIAWAAGYTGLVSGDPAAAEAVLRPACEELERMGDLGHLASSAPDLVEALLELGRPEEAWRWIEATAGAVIDEDIDAVMATRAARAQFLARDGRLEEAELLVREAVAVGERSDYLVRHARVLTVLAEVLRLQGRKAEADGAIEQAVRLYERKGHVAGIRSLRGSVGEPV
jgi:tetratricopeptide (TPR) repeat protein